jgi:hypothetical protein
MRLSLRGNLHGVERLCRKQNHMVLHQVHSGTFCVVFSLVFLNGLFPCRCLLSLGFSLEEKSQPLQGENLRTQQTSCKLSLQQPCPSLLGSEDGFLPKGEFPIERLCRKQNHMVLHQVHSGTFCVVFSLVFLNGLFPCRCLLSLGFSLEEKSQPLQGENLRTQQTSCKLSLQQPCPSLLGSEDGFLPKGEFPILDPEPII